jgi:hypothetical protein
MIDLTIALGLIGIAVAMFLISRMGILPKKSLPYVAAALAGIFGISLFSKYRTDKLRQELEKREQELKKFEEEKLKPMAETYRVSTDTVHALEAEADRQRAAYLKAVRISEAKTKEEKERVEHLSMKELFDEV